MCRYQCPWKGRGAGGEGYTPPMHPSPRGCCIRLLHSRAGGEEQRRKAEAVSVLNRPSLLSTFAHLLCMAWMPSPPHPRPLSPVSRGRGEIFGESAGAVLWINASGCWGDFSFPLSRLSSLWFGCHVPLTPDPSPPFHGGEGRFSGSPRVRCCG